MLSQTLEYSLRAAVYLASQAPQSRSTRQIAKATKVPSAYLSKLLQAMGRAGIVQSLRGVKGGMSLARPADDITILQVASAVDPIERITSCPLKLAAHGVRLCPLHRRLDSALELVEDAFRKTTLAELLAEPTTSVPLCNFPLLSERQARAEKSPK